MGNRKKQNLAEELTLATKARGRVLDREGGFFTNSVEDNGVVTYDPDKCAAFKFAASANVTGNQVWASRKLNNVRAIRRIATK